MGALIGMVALINKNTFEGSAYWKEGAKSLLYIHASGNLIPTSPLMISYG